MVLVEPTAIVPQNFEIQDIVKYYNRYEELLPLGESVQTMLSVRYSAENFEKELGLISQTKAEYDTAHFEYPAYVSVLSWENCSEYVLRMKKILRCTMCICKVWTRRGFTLTLRICPKAIPAMALLRECPFVFMNENEQFA